MTVLTLGNFDGVHLGHRAILRQAREAAARWGDDGEVVALTFDRHPAAVLRPGTQPPTLVSLDERCRRLRDAGADRVEVLPAEPELFSQSPEQFIAGLVERFAPVAIVEGPDFAFGKGRAGDMATLASLGERHGFEAVAVQPTRVRLDDGCEVVCSSSLVRRLIGRGRVEDAARCLGRPHELTAPVVRGEQRGRTLGVPTANLDPEAIQPYIVPVDGVYAGTAVVDQAEYPAAISVGVKPTFGVHRLTVEAHLLEYHPPDPDHLYGREITLRFARWLRDQYPYPDLSSLRTQLARDLDDTRRLTPPQPSRP